MPGLFRYGRGHQQLRRVVAVAVSAGGVRCARGAGCVRAEFVDGRMVGGLIDPGEPWDLGHVDHDRSRYAGAEHRTCNRRTATRVRRRVSRVW